MDSYQKQKGAGTSHQSLFRWQNKFRKIPLFVLYYLTKIDDIMLDDIIDNIILELIQKLHLQIYTSQIMTS